jgi:tetratricopeptide repeat protein 19
MKDEPEEAELILHDALRLAYQSDNKKAITYTYDLVTDPSELLRRGTGAGEG